MKLENRVAVVTGASSGVGGEIALLFAKEGAKVVAVVRRAERLAALEEQRLLKLQASLSSLHPMMQQ